MKKLTAKTMKTLRAAHIVAAAVWVGSLACILLVCAGLPEKTAEGALAQTGFLLDVDIWLIIPAVGVMAVGAVVYGLASNWGFAKHKWVIAKWALFFAAVVPAALLFMPACESMQGMLEGLGDTALASEAFQSDRLLLLGLTLYLLVLSAAMVLISALKPWGKVRREDGAEPARNSQ